MYNIKADSIRGLTWNAIGSAFSTVANFAIGIVLARLLTPTDYGIVGMIAIFFSIAGIFSDGGFSAALIQKKEVSKADTSTIFFFNVGVSVLCYILLFVTAPFIADLLRVSVLKELIRISGLTLVINSLGGVHFTLLTKEVDFKTPTLLGIPLTILQGILGIYMAYRGYGVWALVYPNLIVSLVRMGAIWAISSWRPIWKFSKESFRELFCFGSKLAINGLFDKIAAEGTSLLIGRFYTPQNLGFYSKGMSLAQLPSTYLSNLVFNVTYPILAKIQDDDKALRQIYSKYIRLSSMITFFAMFLLIALARPLVLMLYSEKWEESVIFVQLLSMAFMLYHIHVINWNLLLVKGRSDLALKKEIINKSVRFALLIVAIPIGIVPICFAMLAGTIFDLFVNTYFTGRVCGLGIREQARDFAPYISISFIACLPAWFISHIYSHHFIILLSGSLLSSLLYGGYLMWKKDSAFLLLIDLLHTKLKIRQKE